ncbi:unnamed protein product [Allacma fusca]|uniref:Uncharacterized protein n=1 Tax=Allacma fusca TaxID=39272 RepID=A0A8J2JXL4_9HEXA|nr:unnamed protein product [Allacma fusca]
MDAKCRDMRARLYDMVPLYTQYVIGFGVQHTSDEKSFEFYRYLKPATNSSKVGDAAAVVVLVFELINFDAKLLADANVYRDWGDLKIAADRNSAVGRETRRNWKPSVEIKTDNEIWGITPLWLKDLEKSYEIAFPHQFGFLKNVGQPQSETF